MSGTRYFPVTRLINFNKYDYYYTYGNTPPEDLLQSVTTDVNEPQILLLGCGDIRSCLYTLWNNFDPRHSRHFTNVHFVINDISAAVLARNIIFLYLCTKIPSNKDDTMKWVASFWSIWFCHELLPQHKQILMDALSQLLKWSKNIQSWSEETTNPLRNLVQFATPSTLSEIHKMWQMWYCDNQSVEVMRAARIQFLIETEGEEFHHNTMSHLVRCFGTFQFQKLSSADEKIMKVELDCHYEKGTAFAEDVFGLPVDKLRLVNSTFFETLDGTYNSHNAYPYRCFSHAFQFTSEYIKKLGYSALVKDGSFIDKPLLANSVQQFSVWVRSCAGIFSRPHSILFSFQHSDALDFCQNLCNNDSTSASSIPYSFDAIYTSNLIDYIALPSLLLVAMPILKQTGLLFANAFRYIAVSDGSKGYLHSTFGFNSKYVPLLCGMRCIGYDDEYSAELSVKPVPMIAEADVLYGVIDKPLIWHHVVASPLKKITPKDYDTILNTLCAAVKHILTCFMNGTRTAVVESLLCTETVILLLQTFVSQLDSSEYDHTNPEFWSPLCSLLLKQRCLKPYIMSLQTQSLLHGLHLHLTVSELSCPLCTKKPISEFIGQCSVMVENRPFINEPRVSIFIHNLVDASVLKIWSDVQSSYIDSVHVISTVAKKCVDGNFLIYDFVIPRSITKEDCQLSVVSVNNDGEMRMMHDKLSNCKITDVSYSFNQHVKRCCNPHDLSFGTILQHSGNISCFETSIGLSEQSMLALEHHQMTTSQPTTSSIKVIIGSDSMKISYPYPIEYNKVSIKLSRKNKKITVVAYRKCHRLYEEEQPVYIVNPDNALALPILSTSDDLPSYSGFQYSLKENAMMMSSTEHSPELNAKVTMATILQKVDRNFFQLAYSGKAYNIDEMYRKCQCFVVIENRKFDLWNKTPAVDLWFCFLTPAKCKEIYEQWCAVYETESCGMTHFTPIDEKERELLYKIFNYFAGRTSSVSKRPTNKRYRLLVKHKIDHFFTRAVLYPLYPSHTSMGLGKMGLPNSFDQLTDSVLHGYAAAAATTAASNSLHGQNKCTFCGNHSENLKKCSRCRVAHYCNKDCQRKHWSIHKAACHPDRQK